MTSMIGRATINVDFKYVLADSWFSSSANMLYITEQCRANFIMAIKSNRVVSLTQSDKQKGNYVSSESIKLEGRTMSVYFKQYDKPVLIGKQVLKTGMVVLARSIWFLVI